MNFNNDNPKSLFHQCIDTLSVLNNGEELLQPLNQDDNQKFTDQNLALKFQKKQIQNGIQFQPISDFNETQIAAAILATGARLAFTARILNVQLAELENKIHSSPFLQNTLREANEFILDRAELRLIELVDLGNIRAIEFFLSTKGRDRGYFNPTKTKNDAQLYNQQSSSGVIIVDNIPNEEQWEIDNLN